MSITESESAHRTAGLVYCLWLLGILFGITAIVGVIISHSQLSKVRNTHVYNHFLWQICSFWAVFVGVVSAFWLWPEPIAGKIAMVCFFAWLFSGLIGSWYLSKSRRTRMDTRNQRPSLSTAQLHPKYNNEQT